MKFDWKKYTIGIFMYHYLYVGPKPCYLVTDCRDRNVRYLFKVDSENDINAKQVKLCKQTITEMKILAEKLHALDSTDGV